MHKYKRFWHQIDDPIRLTEDGFLFDPEANSKINRNPNAKTFDTIDDINCLVMLGDQGIGKTYAINEAYEQKKACGANCMLLDTRTGDASYLDRKISINEYFQKWSNGRDKLYIFLDSMDEGSLSVKEKLDVITDCLKNFKSESNRLYIRIACRTASWLTGMEEMFCNFWDQQDVGVYELAPLRWIDVQAASTSIELDTAHFLHLIEEKGITHLASKPITLRWLLEEYKRNGDLPSSQIELLELGCLELCRETSSDRDRYRRLIKTQRMVIAGYIATISALTNKHVIWYGKDRSCFNRDEELSIDDLVGKQDDAGVITLDSDHIKEVLNTALFSGGTRDHRNWSHSSYMDFLAAWYCKDKLEIGQIKSLIKQNGGLVPQLSGFISFISGMNSLLFDDLLDSNPEALLDVDMTDINDHQKAKLMHNILEGREESGLISYSRKPYHNLKHNEMDESLRMYIIDKSKDLASRYEAITIIESCKLKSLQSELAMTALDHLEPTFLRVHAAYAVISAGDSNTKMMLSPLAYGEAGDDPDDELKGCGLRAIWPGLISARELFPLITYPQKHSFFGAYQSFLLHDLLLYINQSDVIYALEWISSLPHQDIYSTFNDIIKKIFGMAIENIDNPEILKIFAKAILSC
ncbi:MAG: NACHT domain-containing protein, partial [Armatimonadota bacterium]